MQLLRKVKLQNLQVKDGARNNYTEWGNSDPERKAVFVFFIGSC